MGEVPITPPATPAAPPAEEPTAGSETPVEDPAPTPAPEPVPADKEVPEADDSDLVDPKDAMDELLEDDVVDLDAEVKVVETPPKGQEPPKEETPPTPVPPTEPPAPDPAAPKKAETPPPAAPAPEQAPPVPTAEPAPVVATPEPVSPEKTMEEIREQYQASRSELETNLAATHYKLSDEQLTRLEDGDASIIPELLSKAYMDAVTGSVAHMITHLPTMMESMLASREANTKFEADFYKAWPQLNPAEHNDTVGKLGQAFRAVNPSAPADEFIKHVGATTLVALGIPPTPVGDAPAADATPPAPVTPPPFQPAGTGSGGAAVTPPINPFEALTEEMEAEDLELG